MSVKKATSGTTYENIAGIAGIGAAVIDDTTPSYSKTYSSQHEENINALNEKSANKVSLINVGNTDTTHYPSTIAVMNAIVNAGSALPSDPYNIGAYTLGNDVAVAGSPGVKSWKLGSGSGLSLVGVDQTTFDALDVPTMNINTLYFVTTTTPTVLTDVPSLQIGDRCQDFVINTGITPSAPPLAESINFTNGIGNIYFNVGVAASIPSIQIGWINITGLSNGSKLIYDSGWQPTAIGEIPSLIRTIIKTLLSKSTITPSSWSWLQFYKET